MKIKDIADTIGSHPNGQIFIVLIMLIVLVFFFGMLAGYQQDPPDRTVTISKIKNGYEIKNYHNDEIEFKFTKQNTDSSSLETLKLIYEGDK